MASSTSPRKGRSRARSRTDGLAGVNKAVARNAVMLADLGLAAATTIGHRTARMMTAAGDPTALADPELARMVTEKLAAGGAASQAVMRDLLGIYWSSATWASRQALLNLRALGRFGPAFPWALALGMGRRWNDFGARLAADSHRALGNAMRPAHRTARANARRLGRAAS